MEWLINAVYYVVPFVVVLGILVFVHELGHFAVARMCGVKVDVFSIGFGKELWGRRDKQGTYWKIAAVPLGGYCQFLGDDDASSAGDGKASELSEEEKKFTFQYQSPAKKLVIALAGPVSNYLFAILIFAGIFFFLGKINFPPVVGEVFENSAAAKAGIVANDRILTINGNKIDSFDDIRKEVDLTVGNEVVVELLRDGREIRLQFPLIEMEVPEANGEMTKRPMLGVKSVNVIELDHEKLSLPQSLKEAFMEAWNVTEATLRGVGQMITGKRSGEEIGGVIRIAEMSGDISKQNGILDLVVFMALLSINLGLINLFPIPVLDGGHIVIYLAEIAVGKEINTQIKDALFKVGFSLIIALMIFATWNDFVRLFHRWFA
ncbi:MAG: RIP metalloprotease RseP [Alphaproteobacteria bacterium]|jgi:RIP metalloprotease rseP|uniref:RIP metalloprotease RseP n=1 Tax=Candidatus Scatocola faecigallinarum TaxID=2840916 RepID=UPI00033F3528|nr:rseP peptidase. Metallo peptidase. MEROPS family M50B [Azospirillum sp. CAG:239]